MSWVVITFILFYVGWLWTMLLAWQALLRTGKSYQVQKKEPALFYSIIVPFRNEAKNLGKLVNSIRSNAFPREVYEIILVDDHSTDDSVQLARKIKDVRVIGLQEHYGKKQALAQGINAARGDVIITTDADCEVSENWLSSICYYFEERSAKLVSGAVTFRSEKKGFHHLQTIEFASLVGSGAAAIQLAIPGMCNAANLAFEKRAFYNVGAYSNNDHLASGDDEFLLHKIASEYPGTIFFNTFSRSFVKTDPLNSVTELIQQRKRWASKWTYYKHIRNSFLAVFIGLVNLSVLIAFFYAVAVNQWIWLVILFKAISEAIFLRSILRFVDKSLHPVYFLLLQIIYPVYVVYFAVVANFGGYTWKGRRY